MGFFVKRLSLIDSNGDDRLLLRNPAGYRGGFWASYIIDDYTEIVESTEAKTIKIVRKEVKDKMLHVTLDHHPRGQRNAAVRFNIDIWSYNQPIFLIRHTTTNITDKTVFDMRVYNFMDFDIGGPRSYKDDFGKYDEKDGIMIVYDDNPLFVSLSSKPKPNGWEISPPAKLKLNEDRRDLHKNDSLGPRDVASALQWNHGNLAENQIKTIDLVMTSAETLDDALGLHKKGWELFDKKIR